MGRREDHLEVATQLLQENCGILLDRSSIFETEPWGMHDQAEFLNQALLIDTTLAPRELLNCILKIENLMGRDRKEKNGPRTIDIDIIFFNHQVIRAEGLIVPHPEMASRRFVLAPLNEIAPAYIHPALHKTVSELLADCKDPLQVKKL